MKYSNGTRVHYTPQDGRPSHTGVIIYYTTDGFHRVKWDNPNPDPDYYNLGTVFDPEKLVCLGGDK